MNVTRRRLLAGSAFLLHPLSLFAETKNEVPSGEVPRSVADRIHALMQASDLPGVGFGYVRHGRVVCAAGFGFADRATQRPVTADTVFHLASVSKVITGTVLMQLFESGLFRLDDPVQPHLDFSVANPRHPHPITFRQIFNHTSSIADGNYRGFQANGDPTIPLNDFLRGYLAPGGAWYTPTGSYNDTEPGTRFAYSNVAMALAGYLAERLTGRSLQTLSAEHVFIPLHMSPAAWSLASLNAPDVATPYDEVDGKLIPIAPIGYPDWPAGLLRTSTRAMTNFICAYANGGRLGKNRILRAETVRTMTQTVNVPPLDLLHVGQGLFWEELTGPHRGRMGKAGGDTGAHTLIGFNPASRNGAVILTNRSPTERAGDNMYDLIVSLLD